MHINRLFAWLLVAAWALCASPAFTAEVRIGVLVKRGQQRCLDKWGPTADYLASRIPGYAFRIVPLDYEEIYPAAEREQVDFILTNPSLYVGLEKMYGVNRIATLKNRRVDGVYDVFGGVIFCRAGRDDIQDLDGLKGKAFMAVDEMSFGGWQVVWRELKKQGIDPQRDFRDLSFGGSQDAVVHAVRDGTADAGAVRTDTLERMAKEGKIRLEDFCVLGEHDWADCPFLKSTPPYPEWPFAELKHTSNGLAEKVAIALVSMPADCPAAEAARCAGWTVPLNYQPVHECLKELRIGPYEDFGKVTYGAVIRQCWPWLLSGLAVLVALALVAIYVLQLNRRLTRAVSVEEMRTLQQAEVARFGQLALLGVSLDELFRQAAALISRVIGTKYSEVLEYRPEQGVFFLRAGVGWKEGWVGHKSIPDGTGSQSGYTLMQAKPVIAEDLASETRFSAPTLLVEHNIVGGMTVAIPGTGRPFGVLGVHTGRIQHFGRDDAHFLESVANVLAGAIERKRTEESLRKSEERFRRFAAASSYGLAMGELSGQLISANAATLQMVEEESEEAFTDKTFYHYYTPDDVERLKQEILPIVREKGQWVGELPLLSARGNLIDTEQNLFLIHDEQGAARMVGNIITDITERKRDEQQIHDYATVLESNNLTLEELNRGAETANRAKSEFLANMSHEIRTPMTAILGFADILMGSEMDREQLDAAATIKQNGEYLIEIINDILDLSKIEAGKMEVELIQCSPCRILSEVVSLMRVRSSAKNLPLEIEYDSPIPQSILTDPTRLRQIIVNLTGNAVKFTEVGKVRLVARLLDAESDEPKMQFEVIDSGIGMTEEQLANLFQPFQQADTSTTRKFGGTGLGLTISMRLAEELGGDIAVRSTLGEGSTFTVTVGTGPLAGVELLKNLPETQPITKSDKKPAAARAKLDCRILLAEDGPDNQRLISFLLKKAGAEVAVADNGLIAHDLALAARDEGNPFDVILMDMQMPVMDGYEATGRLRKSGYTGPIIALTAHAMSTDRDKCLAAGCDDYLSKPIDRDKFLPMVARYAEKQKQEV